MPRQWQRPALLGALGIAGVALVVFAGIQWKRSHATPSEDFYTGKPPVVAAPAPPPVAPTPAPVAATPVAPPPVAPPPVETAPVATPPVEAAPVPVAAAPGAGAFAHVTASVLVTPLDYDPSVPGAREISAARRQLKSNRLSTPPGDNAVESLLAARKLAPKDPAIAPLADEVIAGLGKGLGDAVAGGKDKNARAAWDRAQKFARGTGRDQSDAWRALRAALPPLLVARLEKATKAIDADAIAKTKALAGDLGIEPAQLEPAWTASAALPKPGQVIDGDGPATVLVNNGGSPLAFMRQEVTRADYARFVNATHRPAAKCKNRLAPITIKKRNWSDPGFAQSDSHPVVCVSFADAQAYAQWLSNRTGESYRLPSAAEWKRIASYGGGDACRAGHIDCGDNHGTAPAGQGPASPLGLFGVQGNAREWLQDCAGGCGKHLVAGVGWRDGARNADATRASGFDTDLGFDDVGIRLVREMH
jgi:hypothetical protein